MTSSAVVDERIDAISAGGIANQLAAFASNLNYDAIPAAVRERAKHLALDAVGIAHASTTFDFSAKTVAAVHDFAGDGASPVIASALRLPVRDAAMVNGFLIHGLDFDDTHSAGVIHCTTSTFPCALASAIHTGASGRDLLTAYVLGVEAAARLGAVVKGGFHQVGFHPTGVVGAFACALVAGKLMGLDEAELAMAQGIALSLASGSMEFLEDGAWNKRLHPGWAASSGITAAALARGGFVGATAPYEGRFGLYNIYLDPAHAAESDLSLATAGLGEEWEVMNVAIKPFPACHFVHACADAAIALATEQGLKPADVAHIRALIPAEVVKTVAEPVANKKAPANSYDAQFSIPYAVAASLTRGQFTLAELRGEIIADPGIRALAAKVDYEIDPDSGFPKYYSGALIATTKDGRELSHREPINRGCAERPIPNAGIIEKFLGNMDVANATARAEGVQGAVLGMEELDATAIGRSLAAG